ncbi:MAG: histidine phosphatase family protein [Clostridia bacterium]|nr:histidine phosphatase family protein [Clostridia bacterium]
MKTYKIHLIRHGMTEANADGRYIGRTDLPLSPEGLAALLALKESHRYPGGTRFFTSPLSRCRQTLEVLYPGCSAETVEGLAECDFGAFEGKSLQELKNDERFLQWMEGRRQDIPDGEETEAFRQRVCAAFEGIVNDLIHAGDTEAVICTHGGVITLLMQLYALPRLDPKECLAAPGQGFTLRVTPSIWMSEPLAEALCIIPWEAEK